MFRSFFQAGFECSTLKRRNGLRLDLLHSTAHDRFAALDYRRLQSFGIRTVRLGARWHLIEASPGSYNFDSLELFLNAAAETGMEVLLDLLHFGWPDHVDVFAADFPAAFARFAAATARYLRSRRDGCCRMVAPINEISFLSYAGAEVATINPYVVGRPHELKHNLVRAFAAASDALLNEWPDVRLFSPEPAIHIIGNPAIPGDDIEAEHYRLSQFQAWDMISGRLLPELGGKPQYLDIIGVNFYDRNEWVHNEKVSLERDDPRYRPFHEILREILERYRRPMFISETGTEDDARADWFTYICNEVRRAIDLGIPIHGICLYPILNHLGWEDGRHCCNGLFGYADAFGDREVHLPLAEAILANSHLFDSQEENENDPRQSRSDLPVPPSMGLCLSAAAASYEPLRSRSESLFL